MYMKKRVESLGVFKFVRSFSTSFVRVLSYYADHQVNSELMICPRVPFCKVSLSPLYEC